MGRCRVGDCRGLPDRLKSFAPDRLLCDRPRYDDERLSAGPSRRALGADPRFSSPVPAREAERPPVGRCRVGGCRGLPDRRKSFAPDRLLCDRPRYDDERLSAGPSRRALGAAPRFSSPVPAPEAERPPVGRCLDGGCRGLPDRRKSFALDRLLCDRPRYDDDLPSASPSCRALGADPRLGDVRSAFPLLQALFASRPPAAGGLRPLVARLLGWACDSFFRPSSTGRGARSCWISLVRSSRTCRGSSPLSLRFPILTRRIFSTKNPMRSNIRWI